MADADFDIYQNESCDAFPSFRSRYHVFISFRGETRRTFTTQLFDALCKGGVLAFIDEEGLKGGDEVSSGLTEAIHDSAFAIAVISPRYAESRWCLEELATIVELRKLVMPVFYDVDPSDVRRQRGTFAEDFKRHETSENEEKIRRWRTAMEKVGSTSGWVTTPREEEDPTKLIETIVEHVLGKVNNIPLGVAKYPTGLGPRIEELMKLLDVNANGVKVVHLYGMGGVGKTTLAKAVYNKLTANFRRCCFISNVRETWVQPGGVEYLQKTLHDALVSLPRNEIPATDSEDKVLVVLDDVDDVQQIHALAIKRNKLYTGSRIIITSRDKLIQSGSIANEYFEVTELNSENSMQLFSYHAFGRNGPPKAFMKLSKEIVGLAGGLPLTLEVFGSFLLDKRRIEEWNDALEKLKKTCPVGVHDILKISFDALDEEEKCIFLDIACFFVKMSMTREDVLDILRACGFKAEIALRVLVSKSLIKIIDGDTIWMHDSLREMGRQIVISENRHDPGMRSRLWDQTEVMNVLRNNKGTRSICGIVLELAKGPLCEEIGVQLRGSPMKAFIQMFLRLLKCEDVQLQVRETAIGCKDTENTLSTKAFKHMLCLRLLKCDNVHLQGDFSYMPEDINWLCWKGCPLQSLPSELSCHVLDLSRSKITHLWNGRNSKMAKRLMFANLSECHRLTSIPDLSGNKTLEKLNLQNCRGLLKLHKSVGELSSLVQLNLAGCSNLKELPTDVSGLKKLEKLVLSGCSSLKQLPANIGYMTQLKELNVDRTALETLPSSLFRLENLRILTLTHCGLLKRLPEGIYCLTSLETLALSGTAVDTLPDSFGCLVNLKKLRLDFCSSLTEIPTSIGNLTALESLHFGGQLLTELPSTIGSLSHLKVLSIVGCERMSTLPNSFGGLASLMFLSIEGTALRELPKQIGSLNMLQQLNLVGNVSLGKLPPSFENMVNLTRLSITMAELTELPECIGMLEGLHTLKMDDCKQLKRLPTSIRNLKSLCVLRMKNTALTEMIEEMGMLLSLRECRMPKLSYSKEPTNLTVNTGLTPQEEYETQKLVTVPNSFSCLSSLEELDLRGWAISGKIPDELEELRSLETLKLDRNNISHLPASLKGLGNLKYLFLSHCKILKHLPPLPSGLIKLDISHCTQLEIISDLGEMEYLEDLNLAFCVKVSDIPGLQCLKSLRRLFMGGCVLCFQTVKHRITKATLRKLRNFCVPAGEIPSWFVKEVPCFTRIKHRNIKAALIGVVISLDQHQHDNYRYSLPAVVDIQAKIFRFNASNPAFTTALNLMGVPHSNGDQLYLCRYTIDTPLVLMLSEGDRVEISVRDKPCFNGLTLKKYGIHLIYEKDDDNGEKVNEARLDESSKSVSQKLANFFNSL